MEQPTSLLKINTLDDQLQLDSSRLFYYEGGHFRHDWSDCEVNQREITVRVKWAAGHSVLLHDHDALKFLEITRSRYVRSFTEMLDARNKRRAHP